METIIYEKYYPLPGSDLPLEITDVKDKPENKLTFEQIYDKIFSNITYVLIPSRVELSEKFITLVIDASSEHKLSVKVVKHLERISASFYFSSSSPIGFLKNVFLFSDEINIFVGNDDYSFEITVDFYTHAVFRGDRQIMP